MKYSLPDSANDLLIKDGKLLMRTLSIYEVLRRFGHIIRLTPFRFEDFNEALLADGQSPLIAEIHIQLLRTLMREDKQQQTWLGPPDLRDCINLYLHLGDHCCWPAALRIYLSADLKENSLILNHLEGDGFKTYPFNVDLKVKLDVLEQLCDQFLLSNLAREEVVNGTNSIIKHDNICRSCSKANGDLILCGNCSAVYHLKCSDPPLEDYPDTEEEPYSCVICRSNHIIGVSDCIDPNEKCGRHEALGLDKLGRRYWFLARRLFVVDETEEDVRYYTTQKQFHEIIDSLHENRYEKNLIENLQEMSEEILRQMKITEDLTESLTIENRKDDENSATKCLGRDGAHRNYVNYFSSNHLALGKNQQSDKEINRSLSNKFSISSMNSFKWSGAIDGPFSLLTVTIKSTILKFEASLPPTFIHPCWQAKKASWIRSVNSAHKPEEYALALSQLEICVKPVLFKAAWHDSVGFTQLFRSTFAEREELKKTDRQPRGFERREWFSQDFELADRLGTMVKFSPKLKPVKHQVWKQKGEEYRITGLNGWYWRSKTFKSKLDYPKQKAKPHKWPSPSDSSTNHSEEVKKSVLSNSNQTMAVENNNENGKDGIPTIDLSSVVSKAQQSQPPQSNSAKKCPLVKPKLHPCHEFLTKRTKIRSILILPDLELRKLARSGGLRETRSFSYTAKQNNYVWPYGMTPRPSLRTCWLYRNKIVDTIQDVALQLKVIHTCIRWEELQVRPPSSGHNVFTTDEATVTIELLKKRDKLPYLTHSEYLIKKVVTPFEQPTKYRKIGTKKSTPSARSGLRARRQTEEDEVKGPTTEELWVSEYQLELWELKQFDERIERQNQLMRERAFREEAERRRKIEEEKRRKAEQERRRRIEEEAKKTRLNQTTINLNAPSTPKSNNVNSTQQPRSQPATPVLRYFRTEQGQIIRLPASYLERGTPLILRHVGPGPNQSNTYIIRPQVTPTTSSAVASATTSTPAKTTPGTSVATANATTPSTTTNNITPSTTSAVTTPTSAATAAATTTKMIAPAPETTTSTTVPTAPTTPTVPTAATVPKAEPTTVTVPTAPTMQTALSTPSATAVPTTATAIATTSTAAKTPTIPTTTIASNNSSTTTTTTTTAVLATTETTTTTKIAATNATSNAISTTDSPNSVSAPSAISDSDSVGTVVNEMAHDQHAPEKPNILTAKK